MKYGGRALIGISMTMDVYEIYQAPQDKRTIVIARTAGRWAGAWVGAKAGGVAGGTVAGPTGAAVGALTFSVIGAVYGPDAVEATINGMKKMETKVARELEPLSKIEGLYYLFTGESYD